jgi:hypothetical protein
MTFLFLSSGYGLIGNASKLETSSNDTQALQPCNFLNPKKSPGFSTSVKSCSLRIHIPFLAKWFTVYKQHLLLLIFSNTTSLAKFLLTDSQIVLVKVIGQCIHAQEILQPIFASYRLLSTESTLSPSLLILKIRHPLSNLLMLFEWWYRDFFFPNCKKIML